MEVSKRQQQMAQLIQKELSASFVKLCLHVIDKKIVSIHKVSMSPNLLEARIFISIYPTDQDAFEYLVGKHWEIKRTLSQKIKNNVRKIPELFFIMDDVLAHQDKMDKLLSVFARFFLYYSFLKIKPFRKAKAYKRVIVIMIKNFFHKAL